MAERSLELDSIELAAAIFGSGDQNIHLLEKEFRVTAVCRGSVLRFTGEQKDVDAAARAVDGMVTLMENHTPLEEQTVRYCISLAHGARKAPAGADRRFRRSHGQGSSHPAPKTLGQKEYLAAIREKMPHVRRRACRHRQDVSGCGNGGQGVQVQGCQPHHPDPPRRRGGGEARLSAGRPAKQG